MNLWKSPCGAYLNLDNILYFHNEDTYKPYRVAIVFQLDNSGEDLRLCYTYDELGVKDLDEFIRLLRVETSGLARALNE